MADIVSWLVRECNLKRSKGVDFPTIWQTKLKGHSYVAGSPIQDRNEEGPILKIPPCTRYRRLSARQECERRQCRHRTRDGGLHGVNDHGIGGLTQSR